MLPVAPEASGQDVPCSDDGMAWPAAFRIVSSAFPPISLFEDVLDPADLEIAYAIESLSNDRLLAEAGVLDRVAPEDRISGPGSSPVMAAFTHIGAPSRFTDGSYGVYYCASSLEAAVAETSHHRALFLAATNEPSLELTMRVYRNQVVQRLHDVRIGFEALHQPDPASYPIAQRFARPLRNANSWGLLYRSVRLPGSECAAIFRPRGVSIPLQGPHLRYVWDGTRIAHVFQISELAGG
jgi:hypothetical protein